MKVYVGMPIHTAEYDYRVMFQTVGSMIEREGFHPILPTNDVHPALWVEWLEKNSFLFSCEKLVHSDLENLKSADAILAIMPQPSIGTAMEIAYARQWNKLVVVVVSMETLYHPWLWTFADRVVWSSDPFGEGVRRALQYLHTQRKEHE